MSVFTLEGNDHILMATAKAVDFHHWSSFQDRHALRATMRKRIPKLWEATFGCRERMAESGTSDPVAASGFAFRDGYSLPAMGIEMRGMEILGTIVCTNELARGFRLILFESAETYAAGGDDLAIGIVEIPLADGWDKPEDFFLSNKDKDIVAQLIDYAFGKSSYGERSGHIHDLIDLYDMQIVSDRGEIAKVCTDPQGRCHVMLGTAPAGGKGYDGDARREEKAEERGGQRIEPARWAARQRPAEPARQNPRQDAPSPIPSPIPSPRPAPAPSDTRQGNPSGDEGTARKGDQGGKPLDDGETFSDYEDDYFSDYDGGASYVNVYEERNPFEDEGDAAPSSDEDEPVPVAGEPNDILSDGPSHLGDDGRPTVTAPAKDEDAPVTPPAMPTFPSHDGGQEGEPDDSDGFEDFEIDDFEDVSEESGDDNGTIATPDASDDDTSDFEDVDGIDDTDDFEDVSEFEDVEESTQEGIPSPVTTDTEGGTEDIEDEGYDDAGEAAPVIGWEISGVPSGATARPSSSPAAGEDSLDDTDGFEDYEPETPQSIFSAVDALSEECSIFIVDEQIDQAKAILAGRAVVIADQSDTPVPLALAALASAAEGRQVHLIAKGDASARLLAKMLMGSAGRLGMSCGFLYKGQHPENRRTAYAANIICGTANEIGCWHLRVSVGKDPQGLAPKADHAIVEGLDGLLLDHGRLSISLKGDPDPRDGEAYRAFAEAVRNLVAAPSPDTPLDSMAYDCVPRPDERTVNLTRRGVQSVMVSIGELSRRRGYDKDFISRHMMLALDAKFFLERDIDYVAANREIRIIDKRTGAVLDGPRYSNGLHQAVEAKERLPIHEMGQTLASATVADLFGRYAMLSGNSWSGERDVLDALRDRFGVTPA